MSKITVNLLGNHVGGLLQVAQFKIDEFDLQFVTVVEYRGKIYQHDGRVSAFRQASFIESVVLKIDDSNSKRIKNNVEHYLPENMKV